MPNYPQILSTSVHHNNHLAESSSFGRVHHGYGQLQCMLIQSMIMIKHSVDDDHRWINDHPPCWYSYDNSPSLMITHQVCWWVRTIFIDNHHIPSHLMSTCHHTWLCTSFIDDHPPVLVDDHTLQFRRWSPTMTHYDPLWTTMTHYDPLWLTMTHYDSLWLTMFLDSTSLLGECSNAFMVQYSQSPAPAVRERAADLQAAHVPQRQPAMVAPTLAKLNQGTTRYSLGLP